MNDTFEPKARAANQWKIWLKDGTRLYGRAFSGWGLLMVMVYMGLGYLDTRNDVLGLLAIAFSGVLQLAHLTVIEQMRSGRVGMIDTGHALKELWAEHRGLLGRTVLVRGAVAFSLAGGLWEITHLLAWVLMPSAPHPPSPPTAEPSVWWVLWRSCRYVYSLTVFPLLIQFGGLLSMVLPLLKEGVSVGVALPLDVLAAQRNITSVRMLRVIFVLAVLCGAFLFPPILPLLTVWWMAVTQCMYADVFERGSKIEALAPMRREASTPAFASLTIPS